MKRTLASIASLLLLACVVFVAVPGQANTLHGFCGPSFAGSPCTDNGTITPVTGDTLLQFGFHRDPDSNHGLVAPISFELVALVPSNDPGAGTQMISETGTGTSVTGSQTLVLQPGVFNSGTLDSFLGFTRIGGPDNPIGGFLDGESNQGIPGVTGFNVYLFDFGSVTFGSPDPTFVNSGGFDGVFPRGTLLYSFIDGPLAGQAQDGTALSSTIIVVGHAVVVPDPASLTLMLSGGALVGLATRRRRFRA